MIIDKLGEGHYQTRSGFSVRIDDVVKTMFYPIKGAYLIGQKWRNANWLEDGRFSIDNDSHLSLIPIEPQSKPLPESEQQRPVRVKIRYTNEAERKAAIKQAENYGYKEWYINERNKIETDNCIYLHKDGDWLDSKCVEGDKTIPLDRAFMEAEEPVVKKNFTTENYTFPTSDYTKTENEDGTILLTPIDKDYQANYEKALQFLDKTPEVMWSRENLARICVEFLNSVK